MNGAKNFSEITESVLDLCSICKKNAKINPELYDKYDVKRGLRDKNGTGVLTGLTEIGEVKSYTIDDGEIIPCEGKLYYHGIDIESLVGGFTKDERFGYEETAYLLISVNCRQPSSWRRSEKFCPNTARCRQALCAT